MAFYHCVPNINSEKECLSYCTVPAATQNITGLLSYPYI